MPNGEQASLVSVRSVCQAKRSHDPHRPCLLTSVQWPERTPSVLGFSQLLPSSLSLVKRLRIKGRGAFAVAPLAILPLRRAGVVSEGGSVQQRVVMRANGEALRCRVSHRYRGRPN